MTKIYAPTLPTIKSTMQAYRKLLVPSYVGSSCTISVMCHN